MNNDILKTTLLSIVFMGVGISLSGILLYCFRDYIAQYLRFFLPIPPIGVAAYVFVYNLYGINNGDLPKGASNLFREIVLATVFSSAVFFFTVILIIAMVYLFKNIT